MMRNNFKALVNDLKRETESADRIFISSHVAVDCDNLGSILALKIALKNMGKEVYVLKSDYIPSPYFFLPEIDTVVEPEAIDTKCDLYFSLDCADKKRLGSNAEIFDKAKRTVIIDHHESNDGYADINIIYPDESSTCELLYEIFTELDIEITADIATCLFAGISTDTGRFLYSNVTARTFEIAKELVNRGADRESANINLFQMRSFTKVNVLRVGLENLKLINDGKISYSVITTEDLNKIGAGLHDLDEVIEFIRDIEGVEVAFLVKQAGENLFKVSLRSKYEVDVNKIANRFGGGGHKKAAGLVYEGSMQGLIDRLVEEIINAK